MRVRLPLGRSLFFACAFLFALVALLPLRLALDWLGLDDRGVAARAADGSIWLGRLTEAQAGGVPLGDLTARLASLPLLIGRARVELGSDDAARPLAAAVTVSRGSVALDDATARIDAAALTGALPLASIDTTALGVRFAGGQCVSAEGGVRALPAPAIAAFVPAGLAGTARCDQGALLLPLASPTGGERLDLRLFADGRYTADLIVQAGDPMVRDALTALGFAPAGSGYALSRTGTL